MRWSLNKKNFFIVEYIYISMAQQTLVGQGLPLPGICDHSQTPQHSVELLSTGDQPDAETST